MTREGVTFVDGPPWTGRVNGPSVLRLLQGEG